MPMQPTPIVIAVDSAERTAGAMLAAAVRVVAARPVVRRNSRRLRVLFVFMAFEKNFGCFVLRESEAIDREINCDHLVAAAPHYAF
jgi:hypothetical protein